MSGSAALALAAAPSGFTVAELTAKVHIMTGHTTADYIGRQAAYDSRKLRGQHLVTKPATPAATTSHPTLPVPSPR